MQKVLWSKWLGWVRLGSVRVGARADAQGKTAVRELPYQSLPRSCNDIPRGLPHRETGEGFVQYLVQVSPMIIIGAFVTLLFLS